MEKVKLSSIYNVGEYKAIIENINGDGELEVVYIKNPTKEDYHDLLNFILDMESKEENLSDDEIIKVLMDRFTNIEKDVPLNQNFVSFETEEILFHLLDILQNVRKLMFMQQNYALKLAINGLYQEKGDLLSENMENLVLENVNESSKAGV